jgi:hypothetical protein
MQKLALKSMVMLYKSCRFVHKETKKLSLHYSYFIHNEIFLIGHKITCQIDMLLLPVSPRLRS